jgi:S1-C subfamily serine protease
MRRANGFAGKHLFPNRKSLRIWAGAAGAGLLVLAGSIGIYFIDSGGADPRSPSKPARSPESRPFQPRPLPPDPVGEKVPAAGFVVGAGGFILTSAQLADDPANIMVRLTGLKDPVVATVIATDQMNDLALLQIPLPAATSLRALPICPREIRRGEEVAIWGYPAGDIAAAAPILNPGVLTVLPSPANGELFKIVPGSRSEPGNAGSPMCDHFGNVTGMVLPNPIVGLEDAAVAYVLPAARLAEFLKKPLKDFKLADPSLQKKEWADIDSQIAPSLAMVFKKGPEPAKKAEQPKDAKK